MPQSTVVELFRDLNELLLSLVRNWSGGECDELVECPGCVERNRAQGELADDSDVKKHRFSKRELVIRLIDKVPSALECPLCSHRAAAFTLAPDMALLGIGAPRLDLEVTITLAPLFDLADTRRRSWLSMRTLAAAPLQRCKRPNSTVLTSLRKQ